MPIPIAMQTSVEDFLEAYAGLPGVEPIANEGNYYELYIYCRVRCPFTQFYIVAGGTER